MLYDAKELAGKVIASINNNVTSIKYSFGVDVDEFLWVKGYLKDKEIREKIIALKEEIKNISLLPLDRGELRQMFINRIKSMNDFGIIQISEHLKQVQSHQDVLINESLLNNRKYSGALMHIVEFGLPQAAIDKIFSFLPEGVKEKERSERTDKCKSEINELEAILRTDEGLNIKTRWVYMDTGVPFFYPQGCRWTAYAQAWGYVAQRFESPVDIEGFEMLNPFENDAYIMLGLGERHKLDPLQKPRTKRKKTG
jgi:hypothetical protein